MKMHSQKFYKTFFMQNDTANVFVKIGLLLCCFFMITCGGNDVEDAWDSFSQTPDTEPIRATIKTAVPLAHVASVAMAAVHGDAPPEVTAATTCSSYPCPAVVYLTLDQQNLPFAGESGSDIAVAGLWTSADAAILTVLFTTANAGVPTFPVSKVSTFPVVTQKGPTSGYTLVFADIDINIDTEPDDTIDLSADEIQAEYDRLDTEVSDDVELNLDMDAWVVELDDAGTPDDYTDDSYSISGGGQYIGVSSSSSYRSAQVVQLSLALLQVSHACALNPTDGFSLINELAVATGDQATIPVIATALMGFDSDCDATVKVLLATGNYVAATGSSVPLNLTQP